MSKKDVVVQWGKGGIPLRAEEMGICAEQIMLKEHAIRFCGVDFLDIERVREQFSLFPVDVNVVPKDFSIKGFNLMCFDMDGTLITEESLDELAVLCGLHASFSDITAASMAGKIDFEESLRRRMRFFKGVPVQKMNHALGTIKFSPGAKELIDFAHSYGLKTWIVTGGFETQADYVMKALNMDGRICNHLEVVDDLLTGEILGKAGIDFVDAEGKAREAAKVADSLGVTLEQTICTGDGANDRFMVKEAGLGVGYHPKPILKNFSDVNIEFGGMDVLQNLFIEAWTNCRSFALH